MRLRRRAPVAKGAVRSDLIVLPSPPFHQHLGLPEYQESNRGGCCPNFGAARQLLQVGATAAVHTASSLRAANGLGSSPEVAPTRIRQASSAPRGASLRRPSFFPALVVPGFRRSPLPLSFRTPGSTLRVAFSQQVIHNGVWPCVHVKTVKFGSKSIKRATYSVKKGSKRRVFGRSGASSKVIHNSVAVVDCAGTPLRGLEAAYHSSSAPTRATLCGHRQGSRKQRSALHPRPPAPGPDRQPGTRNQEILYLSATDR